MMMPKYKERLLHDLYQAAQMLIEPKITPVLRGSYRMQGPFDDTLDEDHVSQKNTVPSQSENKFGKHYMSHKARMRGESGTCNLCAAPCSSCMHLNRALMASKTDEFSDETCRVNVASQHSFNGGDTSSSFKSKTCDSLQHTTSETSNLMSVSSSHDSLSENADSKAALRSSNDTLDVETLPLSSGGTTREVGSSPKPHSNLYPGGFSNKYEDSKLIDAHDDDISCVSRANDAYVVVSNSSRNVDRKNMSCSSVSVSSLGPEESKKGHESILCDMPPSKDADASSGSPKEKLCESSPEQIGASSKEGAAIDGASSPKSVAHTSDVPSKFAPKLEAEINNDGQGSTDGSLKCSGPSEQDEKPSKLDKREPPLQSMSGDESDESDIVEHDVKVCDICGDAGREDLLAICSRCSDGAEHTYCMRKMLRKVPGSNWMCEECKFAEEVTSQKHEMEGKKMNKASSSTQLSTKRLAENIEAAPASKRQALENIGSPKSSSPIRMAALSRESSFKNLDKERLRSAHQISVGNQSTNDMLESARSLVAGQRLQNKGTLFKSNSFNTSNSKPKVKLVDEFVPQKQKGGKEYESLDMKDRSARMIRKSMSFKSANSGRSSSSDSKVKMLSPRLALAIDAKGSKQGKERTAFERKSLSRLDRPPISSTTSSSVSTPKVDQTSRVESTSFLSNNRDSKIQSEGKSSTSKSTLNLARKPVETPITTAGASSVGGMCNTAIEQKSNHAVSKDEALSTGSLTTERPSNSVDGTTQDGTRWQEIMHQTEKTKESSVRSRPTVSTSSKSTFCQKCKEIGHSAEFCMSGSSESSGIDVSAARGSREETQRGSKLKDAIHAALRRKPEIQRKKRPLDQSDELSTSSTDLNSEITCQDQALASNKSKIIVSSEGIHEEPQAIPGSSTSDSMQTTVNNTMQHTVSTTNAKFSAIVGDLDSLVPSGVTPVAKDVMNHALATPPQLLKMSAIPEYEYIWRGSFEVGRSGNFLDLCGGIQAHLSTCASPRVPEVVRNFPQKLSLIEVPRLSAWPAQFCDGGAKEDNIALYFFAKDLESYERNYKSLLDGMIKNDLALKGNLDGVELLIFPSNQLPENSQRWNMLFFLWGVFRARRMHCSDSLKKLHIPSINMTLVDKNASNTDMTLSENLSSAKCVDEESSDDRSCNAIVASTAPDHTCDRISDDGNDQKLSESLTSGLTANSVWHDSKCDSKCTSNVNLLEKMRSTSPSFREKSPPEHMPRAELKPFLEVTGANSNTVEKGQLHCDTSVVRKDNSSLKVLPYANEDIGVRGNVSKEKIVDAIVGAAASFCDNRALDEINRGRDQYQHERDLSIKGIEHCRSTERKRPHIAVSDGASPASNVMAQNIPWNGVNKVLVDGENFGKKQKTDQVETYVGSSYNSGTSLGGVEPKQKDVGSFLSVEEKICIEPCEEKIIPEDLGTTTERRFFPVDSRQGNNSTLPWKSLSVGGDDERLLDGPPNLELALGAETKPQQNKGILPFLVGLVDNKRKQEKPQDKAVDGKEEDDEDSASLSLSLSFPPFPGNEPPVKPASKSEQLRPERHHVNTSLLLFGSFSDK